MAKTEKYVDFRKLMMAETGLVSFICNFLVIFDFIFIKKINQKKSFGSICQKK